MDNATLDAQYTALLQNDPIVQGIVNQVRQLRAPKGPADFQPGTPQYALEEALRKRMEELGINTQEWHATVDRSGIGVDHQNFIERHPKLTTGLIGGAIVGAPLLGGLFGGSAAAAPAATAGGSATGTAVADAAGRSAGRTLTDSTIHAGADTGIRDFIKLVMAGAVPAIGSSFYNGGASGRNADSLDALVQSLTPELTKQFQMNTARSAAAQPLYDAVLKTAMTRMPVWGR